MLAAALIKGLRVNTVTTAVGYVCCWRLFFCNLCVRLESVRFVFREFRSNADEASVVSVFLVELNKQQFSYAASRGHL